MVFGMMMAMMGMLPMVAQLVGSLSSTVGAVVHLVNSMLIGAAFGIAFRGKADSLSRGAYWGALYGMGWWVMGALIIMPLWLGMPVQLHMEGIQDAMPSLMGHLIYGAVTGLVFARLARQSVGKLRAVAASH